MKVQIGTTSKGKAVKVEIEGVEKLNKLLKRMPEVSKKVTHNELKIIALDLRGKAQILAPKASIEISGYVGGDLEASAYSEVKDLTATIGFAEPYALRQHEEMGYRHSPGKQAKYLETPYKENLNKYIDGIKNAVKEAVSKP